MSILSAVESLNPFAGLIGQNSSNNYLNPAVQPSNSAPAPAKAAAAPAATPTTQNNTNVVAATTPVATGPTPAQQAAQNEYNSQYAADQSSINSGITSNAGDYNQSILDLINSNKNAQNKINSDAVQNELARDQGMQGVTSMVGNGIQGGGVQIDDAGGGTSSAGEALARDYGIVGRQAASQVGNQYAQGNNTINNEQTEQNNNEQTQLGDEAQKKTDTINTIVSSANQQLQYLDSLAQSANITDLPDINSQIASVKAQATAALSAFDSELSGVQVAPTTQAANQATAQGLFAAGTAPANAFNFTTTAPANIANTGPSPSSLPIYIAPANKNNDQTT